MILAVLALFEAVHGANSELDASALTDLIVALLLCVAAVAARPLPPLEERGAKLLVPAIGLGFLLQFAHWAGSATEQTQAVTILFPFYVTIGACAVLAGWLLHARGREQTALLAALFCGLLFLGVWVIGHTPDPDIDVVPFHYEAFGAFLHGINPYALRLHNPYPPARTAEFYAPWMVGKDGLLNFGFAYPPASFFISLAGQLATGDFRYAQLAALAGAGLLLWRLQRGASGGLVAVLLVFSIRALYVCVKGWTEPYVLVFLALTLWCALRDHRRALPVALGVLLALKQSCVLALPLIPLLAGESWTGRGARKLALQAVGVAALVTLPMALWDFRAFWYDLVTFQTQLPFRPETLSFSTFLWSIAGVRLPFWAPFAALLPVYWLGLTRAPRTPAGFAATLSLAWLVFFAFSSHGFLNYYFLVAGSLCCAVAALPFAARSPAPST